MDKHSKIFVAGSTGLVGSAIVRRLEKEGYSNILKPARANLDLSDQQAVAAYFTANTPEYIFLAAAKVGGIMANNTFPADFIFQNLMIQNAVIHQSHVHNVKKLIFLGSSCVYPKHCPQPMKEEYLMTGPLEPTNSPYAVAKIAGIEMCWAYNRQYQTRFIPVMPTNTFGPNDHYDLETSHVLPALIRKFHEAKKNSQTSVTIWGTGSPKREFIHVDDLADACVFLMNMKFKTEEYIKKPLFNIGTGKDISIKELACLIKEITGFNGKLLFDASKPDGTPQKLLDVSRMKHINWTAKISLRDGIKRTYDIYKRIS